MENLEHILNDVRDGVYLVDRDRRISFWNRAAEKLTGYRREQVDGEVCTDGVLCHVDESGRKLCEETCPFRRAIDEGEETEAEIYLRHARGHRVPVRVRCSPLRDAEGRITGAAQVFSESSDRAAALERVQELEEIAFLDPLTCVGNRRYAEMMLEARLQEEKRYGRRFGILFVDLDRFKAVNDKYGHAIGDRALVLVGMNLASNQRAFDVCSRWGGEEFLLILTQLDDEGLSRIANRYRVMIKSSRLPLVEDPPKLTVSIGATIARDGDSVAGLVARADGLMYKSKRAGGDRVTLG